MRIYTNLTEAQSEIKRDLREMGIPVRTLSYQNRPVESEELATIELQDYSYRVTEARTIVPKPGDEVWASVEWGERVLGETEAGDHPNPGDAWKLREQYWRQFMGADGMFDYTYGERIPQGIRQAVDVLSQDPSSRRAIVPMWRTIDPARDFRIRVPCTMYYHLMIRDEQMSISYHQRSCDFMEHWQNDLYFARLTLEHVATRVSANRPYEDISVGWVTHHIGSLHAYNKDLQGVF